MSTSIEKCYAILLYHPKKPLYYLYHPILQYLPHPKTLFLLKYYSLIFFYYFFLTNIFFQFHFPRLSNRFFFFFFLSLPQPLAPAPLTEPHRPINRATHSHTQTIKPEPTTATTPTTDQNHTADLKPSPFETHRSKPIQKISSTHHRSTHNPTTTQTRPKPRT